MVLGREGGTYRVLIAGIERIAILRGKAKRDENERAVAGDRVLLDQATLTEDMVGITGIEPRKSILERRVQGGRGTRPVAANVDQVVVVIAAASPDPIPHLLDRLLVVAEANDIPPIVVVNKVDLASADGIHAHLSLAGYPVLETSTRAATGISALQARLVDRESVFTGPSGAGKSSLLNAIEPELGLRVGAISAKAGRGRHTTVTATLIPLAEGGFVVDTPGFSEVGVWAIEPGALDQCFPEFSAALGECKYGDCMHRGEPGCAVRELAEADAALQPRYASYLSILNELEGLPQEWE